MSETTLPKDWEARTDGVEEIYYETMIDMLRDDAVAKFQAAGSGEINYGWFDERHVADVAAMAVLKTLSGLSISQIKQILQRADFWLDATTTFSADASAFRAADEALLGAFGREVVGREKS